MSCGSTNTTTGSSNLRNELEEKNRVTVTLLQRISQKRGIVTRNGVPFLNRLNNTFSNAGSQEPLYVLNSQVIGNSFNSLNELVDSFNVKTITVLSGTDASSFGTQGGNGVILIKTY